MLKRFEVSDLADGIAEELKRIQHSLDWFATDDAEGEDTALAHCIIRARAISSAAEAINKKYITLLEGNILTVKDVYAALESDK